MTTPLPPYALTTPSFPCRALASFAGRAPLGGGREVALATFVAARLVAELVRPDALPPATLASRAAGARAWIAALTLPAPTRVPLARLLDALGATSDAGRDGAPPAEAPVRARVIDALEAMAGAVGSHLDAAGRQELEQLCHRLKGRPAETEPLPAPEPVAG